MSFFTAHAQERARERYGLRLFASDFAIIGHAPHQEISSETEARHIAESMGACEE